MIAEMEFDAGDKLGEIDLDTEEPNILVIGGSQYYTGAPALVGLSAYRTGADLVIIAAPKKVAPNLRNYSPNLIVRDLPGDVLSEKAMSTI